MKLIDKKPIAERLALCLYFVLACSYVPLCLFLGINSAVAGAISLAVCVLGIFAMSRAAGTFKAVIGFAIILGLFLFFGGSLVPAGIFSAFASATCIYAHLHLRSPSPFLWGLPIIPLIITLLTVGSLSAAAISLITLLPALALVYSVKKGISRVGAICRISAGICAITVVTFLLAVYSSYGEVSFASVKQTVDTAKEATTQLLIAVAHEAESALGASDAIPVNIEETVSYATGIAFNVLPAIIVIFANVIGYILHSMMLSIEYVSLEDKKKALPMMTFEMSVVSAIVFLSSLVLSLILTSGKTELYGAAAQNVMFILIPGLVLTALGGLRVLTMKKGPSCLGTLVYMGVIFLIASLNAFVLIAVSVAGAILIIASHVARARSEKS